MQNGRYVFGRNVSSCLISHILIQRRNRVLKGVTEVYCREIDYLSGWHNFKNNPFKYFCIIELKNRVLAKDVLN
jgi:hypothetical protein